MIYREMPKGIKILDKEPVEVSNRFSGEKVTLQPDAVAVYDTCLGAEAFEDYNLQRECLNWFRKHEPNAYMVLLD